MSRHRTSNEFWHKIHESLLSERSRDFMVFLFFLAVSTGFWILQKLNDTFEIEVDVPISLVGVPNSITITTPLPETVTVVIKDRGTQLVNYINRDFHPIPLEFSLYDNGNATGRGHIPLADVHHALTTQLLATSHIQRISPDTLEFYYNRGLYRRLPVRYSGTITTTPQNYLHDVTFTPETVTVYAPSLVLDTMTSAYTKDISIEDLSENYSKKVGLRFLRGVKYEPAVVTMTAHVDYYTEKTVTVPITGINFPADKSLKAFPATVKVTFRVGAMDYDKINAEDFVLTVSYEELLENRSDHYHLQFRDLPTGVSNVRISPADFEYLIEDLCASSELQEE